MSGLPSLELLEALRALREESRRQSRMGPPASCADEARQEYVDALLAVAPALLDAAIALRRLEEWLDQGVHNSAVCFKTNLGAGVELSPPRGMGRPSRHPDLLPALKAALDQAEAKT